MPANLAPLFKNALIDELEQLRDGIRQLAESLSQKELWARPTEPGNSIGHLILHLTGNLNHYVGAQLGKTGYVRDRDREFTESTAPAKADILTNLDSAVATFRNVVDGLDDEQLAANHPEPRFTCVLNGLVHLVAHFALHRGQMSYIAPWVRTP